MKNYSPKLMVILLTIAFIQGCQKEMETGSPALKKLDLFKSTVSDIDGNTYRTVMIGPMEWMAENLRTTRYNDGAPLDYSSDFNVFRGAYHWVNDEVTLKSPYGALYNFQAVKENKLAPAGWHVAERLEWEALIRYSGGIPQVLETGSEHWYPDLPDGTNESGFTALPSYPQGFDATWWSATWYKYDGSYAMVIRHYPLLYDEPFEFTAFEEIWATYYQVRCVKNALPVLSTGEVTELTGTSGRIAGEIKLPGGPVTERGVCWSKGKNPTIRQNKAMDSQWDGFSNQLTKWNCLASSLEPGSVYHARAYAVNSTGIGYGEDITFKTLP